MQEEEIEIGSTCPKCGGVRRLVGAAGDRKLACGTFCSEPDVRLPADLKLTIKQMTADMARASFLSGSDEQRREQVKARRTGSSVRGYYVSPYVSKEEADTLAAAADILERIGTAAEHAKKELKRLEDTEKARQERRRKTAAPIIHDALTMPGELREALPLALAIDAVTDRAYRTSLADKLGRELSTPRPAHWTTTIKSDIWSELHSSYRDCTGGQVTHIAWEEQGEAATMAHEYVAAVRAALADSENAKRAASLLERIEARLVQERLEQANPQAGREQRN